MQRILVLLFAFGIVLGSDRASGIDGTWRLWLDSSRVTDLAADGSGGVWCATEGGVVKWHADGSYVKYSTLDGLPCNWTNAIAIGGAGTVWAGGMQGGIARFESGVWRTFTDVAGARAKCMAVDGEGHLWLASGSSVYEYDGTSWRNWKLSGVTGIAAGGGKVWCGTDGGLSCFDGAVWKAYTTADGLVDNKVTAVAADAGGVVWAGSRYGVSSFDGARGKHGGGTSIRAPRTPIRAQRSIP